MTVYEATKFKFNSGYVSPLCKLCNENNEELSHFLLYCPILEKERQQLLSQITEQCLVLCHRGERYPLLKFALLDCKIQVPVAIFTRTGILLMSRVQLVFVLNNG
jgi:hypothetical protein